MFPSQFDPTLMTLYQSGLLASAMQVKVMHQKQQLQLENLSPKKGEQHDSGSWWCVAGIQSTSC
jgi:hypothetical protein